MREADLKTPLLVAASKAGARLFRQNVAKAWIGSAIFGQDKPVFVQLRKGDVLLRQARVLHAGLCKGSSDFVGWTPVTVTPDMVGQTLAVFTAVETKRSGSATQEQRRFLDAVRTAGGLSGIARSVAEGLAILARSPVKQNNGEG